MSTKLFIPEGARQGRLDERSHKFMVTTNLDRLPGDVKGNMLKMQKMLEDAYSKESARWVLRLHPDTKHPHVFISLYTVNARTRRSVAKSLGVPASVVLIFRGSAGNLFSYPFHKTSNARILKETFDYDSGIANFDVAAYLEKVEKAVKKSRTEVDDLIDQMVEGKLTESQLIDKISLDEYLKKRSRIAYAKRDANQYLHERYLRDFKDQKIQVTCFTDLLSSIIGDGNLEIKHGREFMKKQIRETNGLSLKRTEEIKSLAIRYAKSLGSYKLIDPYQYYFYGVRSEDNVLVFPFDDYLDARKSQRGEEACWILNHIIEDPLYHDYVALNKRQITKLNIKHIIVYSENILPLVVDPYDLPDNIQVIGTNEQYKQFKAVHHFY